MSTRDNPFDEMERMFDQMRRSMWGFDRDARPMAGLDRDVDSRWSRYDTNLSLETDDDGYVVYADLPGFEKSDIDLRFDGDALTIEATHATEDDSSARARRVYEQVRVPGGVVEDEIAASYRNGVLEVHLPSPEAAEAEDSTSIDIE